MSDAVLISLISGSIALFSTVFTGIMAYLMLKLNRKADAAAVVGDKIHKLVNSAMGAQLKINVIALRRIAFITKEQSDIDAADESGRLLAEHDKQQAKADLVGEWM